MPKTRIPSPARSQGVPSTPRRYKLRGSRSITSPARSHTSGRLTAVIQSSKENKVDSFVLSPLPSAHSLLKDTTDIEKPRRTSWWKNLGECSRDVMEVLQENDAVVNNRVEELQVSILSREQNNYTFDLPESSDSESISSIVIPQRKLFTQKDNHVQNKYWQLKNEQSISKLQKTNITNIENEKTINPGPKKLFGQGNKLRRKPIFPAELIKISPNKTTNKTKEIVQTVVQGPARSLFGRRTAVKRKNMFTDFILSESEDEETLTPRGLSPINSVTRLDMTDDWKLLPSSTMVQEMEVDDNSKDNVRILVYSDEESDDNRIEDNVNIQNTSICVPSLQRRQEKDHEAEETEIEEQIETKENEEQIETKDEMPKEFDGQMEEREDDNEDIQNEINASQETEIEEQIETKENEEQIEAKDEMPKEFDDQMEERENDNEDIQNDINASQETENEEQNDTNENEEQIVTKENEEQIDTNENEEQIETKENKKQTEAEENEEQIETEENEEQSETEKENEEQIETKDEKSKQIDDEMEGRDDENEDIQNGINASHDTENEEQSEPKENEEQIETKQIENHRNGINTSHETENEEQIDTNENEEQIETEEYEERSETKENEEQSETKDGKSKEFDDEMEEREDENEDIQKGINVSQETENEEQMDTTENEEQIGMKENVEESKMEENDEQSETEQIENEDIQNGMNVSQATENEEQMDTSENEEQNDMNENVEESETEENDEQSETEDEKSKEFDDEMEEREDENEDIQNDINTSQETDTEEQIDTNENEDQIDTQENEEQSETEDEKSKEFDDGMEEREDENEDIQTGINNSQETENEEQIDTSENEDYIEREDDVEQSETDENGQIETKDGKSKELDDEMEEREDENEDIQNGINVSQESLNEEQNREDHEEDPGLNEDMEKTEEECDGIRISKIISGRVLNNLQESENREQSEQEGSGWDSHRVTRKTLRQTFGKEFTPRKSLRALVMEKSAKRHTVFNDTFDTPPANSTEYPDAFDRHDDIENEENVQNIPKRMNLASLERCLQKMKKENLEKRKKMQEAIRDSLKIPENDTPHMYRMPARPTVVKQAKKITTQDKPKNKKAKSVIPLGDLPKELLEDMKYKPPKRYKPRNVGWVTKRLYKYLETKLEPKYDYKARVRAEKLVETLYNFTKAIRRLNVAPADAVQALKHEMARLDIVKTHHQFYGFIHEFMPREVRVKVVPDIVNKIPLPRHGPFSDILSDGQ